MQTFCAHCKRSVSNANYARHIRAMHPWLPVARRGGQPSQAQHCLMPLGLPTIAAGTAGPAAAGTAAPISETDNALNLLAAAAAPATTEQSTQMKMGGYDDGGEFIVPP